MKRATVAGDQGPNIEGSLDPGANDTELLTEFLEQNRRLVVLTGAGVSLASGIPTYRDQHGKWLPNPPIQERDFLQQAATRRRYWTRSWYGWPTIRDAVPNQAHAALARLEQLGRVDLLITQNVDGLHQRAGSRNVVDLHGRVDRVLCMECSSYHCRNAVQDLLRLSNDWPDHPHDNPLPDGDMQAPPELERPLSLPTCPDCGGALRPDVVFFGGSVPPERVEQSHQALARADALLVAGSSLKVFSGYRFCRRASELGKPIALINPGLSRGDPLATLRLKTPAADLLSAALAALH